MKKPQLASITGAELRVLEELWRRGDTTIRDLRDALYPDGGSSKFATVQKLLSRLVAKDLVHRRKDEANWVFQAAIARDELIGGELRRVADRLGENSMTPLLTCLVEGGLTAREKAHLRALLDGEPGRETSFSIVRGGIMPLLSWVGSNAILALVLALAAWVAQRKLGRPAVAHALWVLALVKLVTPPLVVVPLGRSPGLVACALGTCGCDHAPAQSFVRDSLPWILFAVWLVGAGAAAGVAWHRWARFRSLTALAGPAPEEWQSLAARLSSEYSLRYKPEILAVPGRLPPLVIPGRYRPCVLLPADLLSQLSASQRDALLTHELVHIRRGDHLVRILETAVRVVYWWLPGVGLIGRRLRACEEACCDAAVVARLPYARREYATLLLDVVDFTDPPAGEVVSHATTMSAAAVDLERRLRAILDVTPRSCRTRLAWAFAAGLGCAILPCGLHYDFAARPKPAAPVPVVVGEEPVGGPTRPPDSDRGNEWSKIGCCCPS